MLFPRAFQGALSSKSFPCGIGQSVPRESNHFVAAGENRTSVVPLLLELGNPTPVVGTSFLPSSPPALFLFAFFPNLQRTSCKFAGNTPGVRRGKERIKKCQLLPQMPAALLCMLPSFCFLERLKINPFVIQTCNSHFPDKLLKLQPQLLKEGFDASLIQQAYSNPERSSAARNSSCYFQASQGALEGIRESWARTHHQRLHHEFRLLNLLSLPGFLFNSLIKSCCGILDSLTWKGSWKSVSSQTLFCRPEK